MPSSRRSSQPRDRTQVSHIAGRFFTIWATREALQAALRVIKLQMQKGYLHQMHTFLGACHANEN